jgi:hypothetical protein
VSIIRVTPDIKRLIYVSTIDSSMPPPDGNCQDRRTDRPKTLLKLSNDDTSRNLLGTELAKLAKV